MDRSVGRDPRRENWRSFICSDRHAGRHLGSIGAGVLAAKSDQIELDELIEFLGRLDGGESDVLFLSTVVELVSGGYEAFFTGPLVDLLAQLSSETERRDQIVGPALVGSPRWGPTLIARASGHLPLGRYYSRTAHRSYDIPENRVVAWLVSRVAEVAMGAVVRMRGRAVPFQLAQLATVSGNLIGDDVIRSMPRYSDLRPPDLDVAERSHRPEYRTAAALCRSLARLTDGDAEARWHAILMLLAVNWLEPVSDDDLFELYILVLVIDVLSKDLGLGEPVEFGLVMGGRRHVARFEAHDTVTDVFFDQSFMTISGERGEYSEVVRGHDGVTGAERRPDIVVARSYADGADPRYALVEIKRSDRDRYISDGIYKIFGYLHDHRRLWPDASPRPKAVLSVPGRVRRTDGPYGDVAVVSGDDRDGLAEALRCAFADLA